MALAGIPASAGAYWEALSRPRVAIVLDLRGNEKRPGGGVCLKESEGSNKEVGAAFRATDDAQLTMMSVLRYGRSLT